MLSENQSLYDRYFSLRSVSPRTMEVYNSALLSYDEATNAPLTDLDEQVLKKWYRILSEKSPATIQKYTQLMRMLYAYTLEEKGLSKRKAKTEALELFDVIPLQDIRKRIKKENNLRDKLVTPQEFQALMSVTDNVKLRALMAVTYESGCRKGEIYSLRIKDVSANADHWTLTVQGKTGTRTVPIIKSIPYLRAWIQQHPDRNNKNQWLFTRLHEGKIKRLGSNSFNDALRYFSKKAGLRKIYPHQLRHTRLTQLAEDGLGEYQMKSFAGWTADSNMAARYIHLSGRGHISAVLEAEGLETEGNGVKKSIPLIELSRCPNCDEPIDPQWVQCPHCQFILDSKLGISQQDKISELETTVEELKVLLMDVLNKPEALAETVKRLAKNPE